MPEYRRRFVEGGTYFFTLVTADRTPLFREANARRALHVAIEGCRERRPFEIEAMVLLHDHLHLILSLPNGDRDFPTRLAAIKANFTRAYLSDGGRERSVSRSRASRGHRGVWQKRFWEHLIRDDEDLTRHLDYVHYNPVKHGLARCPHEWEWSSFHRYVAQRNYERDWGCQCGGSARVPDFNWATQLE